VIGLIFLLFIGLWFACALWLARRITSRLSPSILRVSVAAALVVAMLVLPLLDEIIGASQFNALCKQNTAPVVQAKEIVGRRVRVSSEPANQEVSGTAVRILYSRAFYRDAETNEAVAYKGRYVASGGWLIRTLSGSASMTPLTFSSTCDGVHELERYNLSFVR
jgi:hypothetical protein